MESDLNILEDCKSIMDPMTVEDADDFNGQILAHIDSTILTLAQLGCIKDSMPMITADTTWSDIINPPTNQKYNNEQTYAAIRTVIKYTVRILFDPPVQNVMDIYRQIIDKNEWRIAQAYAL